MASTDGSMFMRPLAFGWTAYLFGGCLIFLITRGAFHSPDSWAEIYTLILATYAGAPEVKRWVNRTDPSTEPNDWQESIRKGGPLVIAWNLLLMIAGVLRMYDPSWPMPPELKSITMQITTLFFGTYAFRQVRRRSVQRTSHAENGPDDETSDEAQKEAVLNYLRQKGPTTPAGLTQALGLPRRTLARVLARLMAEKAVVRDARYPSDPAATYHLPS